ncbi:alpha/beta hydrolase [Streptomyces sp. NPDC048484]|uniref:alpha/beta hydrolase n=1 Tax=Streptomyces sp. NPDC048484 TaxID=3155146 RepID=UPI003448BEAF
MALDAATTEFLTAMAEQGGKPLHELPLEQARELTAGLKDLFGEGPRMVRVEEHTVPTGEHQTVPVRFLLPREDPPAVVVYYHGGGWMLGSIDGFDALARRLAEGTGCAVALVDYRLAPEHPYPAAVDDAWAALSWVSEHLAGLAGGQVPLIVAGDSAGATLATVVARRARHRGGPPLSLQILVYPVTHYDLDTSSYTDPANQLLVTRDLMARFWDAYVPTPAVRLEPEASPLRADDLTGLPPALVITAEYDVLRDEGEAYAEKLRAADVPVRHRRFEGQMHGFFTMSGVLPGSAQGIAHIAAYLAHHLKEDTSEQDLNRKGARGER